MKKTDDQILNSIILELKNKYRCHTVILYGSRARGTHTSKSDYDVMGVRKTGKKLRIAKKRSGSYLDVFIFAEKDLQKIGEQHLYMKDAQILFQKGNFGTRFLQKLKKTVKKPHKSLPSDELKVRRVWAYKMLERIEVGDIEAQYRRSWLHTALLEDYFTLRKKRYWGSKESFAWMKENDPSTYKLFAKVLDRPRNLVLLRKLVDRVTQV